ncbi:hypothetical protein [Pseudomonas sp. SDO52101_S400]
MENYRILYWRERFGDFKKSSSQRVNKIPAKKNDDFALVSSVDREGAVGFDRAPQGRVAINALISSCYFIDIDGRLQPPSSRTLGYMPLFIFRDKDKQFEKAVSAHGEYEKNYKKYKVLSRHREAERPVPTILTKFLFDGELPMDKEVYEFLIAACHYVAVAKISGEYGFGAFDVFSDDLEFFFDEFRLFAGDAAEWVAVEKASDLIVF